jgi:hypothetical protein
MIRNILGLYKQKGDNQQETNLRIFTYSVVVGSPETKRGTLVILK